MSEEPQKQTIRNLLKGKEFNDQLRAALPKHFDPERQIRIALTALMRTPKLEECDHASFFQCLLQLSQFGLEPDGRMAHLIPFNNRKRDCVECQLIIDYKGIVELVMRTGIVSLIHADVVCENDEFEYNLGEITKHRINFKKDRGAVYAVYCLIKFKDGTVKADVMASAAIERIRGRSKSKDNGPWVTDWDEMAKKTVFKRLSKWVPWSAEIRDAVAIDNEEFIETTATAIEKKPSRKPQTALPKSVAMSMPVVSETTEELEIVQRGPAPDEPNSVKTPFESEPEVLQGAMEYVTDAQAKALSKLARDNGWTPDAIRGGK